MWTTIPLALALTLAPGADNDLALTHVRQTYGLFGAERTSNKLLPGDQFYLAFIIENLKVDKTGLIRYSMAMEVVDAKGKSQYKEDPRDLQAVNALGGSSRPAFANVDVGLDQPPGEYTLKLTVTDRAAKLTKTLERKFEVLRPDFGLVRLQTTATDRGEQLLPAPRIAVPGQSLYVNFVAVGFSRDNKKQADISAEMTVLDEKGDPVLEPFTGHAGPDVPKDAVALPMQFALDLNRTGKFTIRLRATDNVSKKKAELTFPITVVEPK